MFEYVKTYSIHDYDRQPSYDFSPSWLCAFNGKNEQPTNPKTNEGKQHKWVYID